MLPTSLYGLKNELPKTKKQHQVIDIKHKIIKSINTTNFGTKKLEGTHRTKQQKLCILFVL